MSSDLFLLSALAEELDGELRGARIDKIQQPETDELRFFMRGRGKNACLVVSCNSAAPRIHLTDTKKQSPQAAPAFLMLLRKHLINAAVESVSVFNNDRIIKVAFNARTEMRDDAKFYIFAEIMSRYSNIVFTDENYTILDSVKRLAIDSREGHAVLRGLRYEPIVQPKISYLTVDIDIFDTFSGGDLHKFFLDNISGFSGTTVSEILDRTGLTGHTDPLGKKDKERLFALIAEFRNITKSGLYSPVVTSGRDIYPFAYNVLRGEHVSYHTLSAAFDDVVSASDKEIRNKARLRSLANAAKRLRLRAEKNIDIDNSRLAECRDMEKYRIYGEMVVANIYKIKRGDTVLKCTNYYDNTEMEIPLDERLSPSKNSAFYYNKYNKLKRTKEFTENKLLQDLSLLDYLRSVEQEIASLPYESSIAPIEAELEALGGYKRKTQKGKVRKEQTEPPFEYEYGGFTILKGRNNIQNDELTFRTASSQDMWVHLKNAHGPHVIILTNGKEVPDDVIKVAGEIASSDQKAPMEADYTLRRNVKRQPGGRYGQVIYVNYKTMISEPNAHEELKIR